MNNATKDFSSKQEKTVADYLGWRVVTGSGSRPGIPGDIVSTDWLGECKTHVTSGKKITFKQEVWNKIKEEAASKFKLPVLIVDDGSQKISRTWCLFKLSISMLYEEQIHNEFSVVILPLEYKHVNISFSIGDLLNKYNFEIPEGNIFIVNYGEDSCAVCNLATFKDLLEAGYL